jgi:hypothetical protein
MKNRVKSYIYIKYGVGISILSMFNEGNFIYRIKFVATPPNTLKNIRKMAIPNVEIVFLIMIICLAVAPYESAEKFMP